MVLHLNNQDSTSSTDSQNAEAQEDFGYYAPLDDVEKMPVAETEIDTPVYGLNLQDDSPKGVSTDWSRRNTLIAVVASVIAVLAISHFLVGFPPLPQAGSLTQESREDGSAQATDSQATSTEDEDTTPEGEGETAATEGDAVAEDERESMEQQPSGLSQADLTSQACALTFDGTDLSVPAEEVSVEVSQGNVQVSHTPGGQVSDGTLITRNAAQQAAALCNGLNDQWVKGDGENAASPFTGVTWIVRNESGDAYLVVRFNVGSAPTTGDGLTVLTQATAYRLSGSVYYAMGQAVPQAAGETITSVSGEEIVPAADIVY